LELFDFPTLIQSLIDFIVSVGQQVNDLPGGLAFTLGLVTWFVVEQILRRLMSWVRWLILAGAVVALGYTVPYIYEQVFSRAELPEVPGLDLSPEDLQPSTPN